MSSPRGRLWPWIPLIPLAALAMGADECGQEPQLWTEAVPAADGTLLASDVYVPAGGLAPTILMRTPYTKESGAGEAQKYLDEGYSVVSQDIRGTGASGGAFRLFFDDAWGENQDGADTVSWIASQPWNGGLGTCAYGYSALSLTSYYLTGASPADLKCVYAKAGDGDLYHHTIYQGGAIREETIVYWLEGLVGTAGDGALASLQMAYDHPLDDGFWDPIDLSTRFEDVTVPVYHAAGWYDVFLQAGIDAFVGLQTRGGEGARGAQKLQIGPWSHWGTVGSVSFPQGDARGDQYREWFDYHLRGAQNGMDRQAPVTYFVMGDVDDPVAPGNVWRTADTWPPASTPTSWFLHAGGLLTRQSPDAGDGPAAFTFDPADPVPTLGGNTLTSIPGPWDQRLVLYRPDVLLYLSPELVDPVTVAGRMSATLYVSSSAVDTDFTVKLMDVYPDFTAINVQDGIRRMRSREGQDREVWMTPGEVYEAEIDLWSTAYAFNRGHRIAVAISSSNFPRFDVNPGTGGWSWEGGPTEIAHQQVFQDAEHPSRITLPVVR